VTYQQFLMMFFELQVMKDPQGQSRGSGFVAFSSAEEATRAVCFFKSLSCLVLSFMSLKLRAIMLFGCLLNLFKVVASQLERKWMSILHTFFPRVYNLEGKSNNRRSPRVHKASAML
jgi:RNA recognition motif-containing protein